MTDGTNAGAGLSAAERTEAEARRQTRRMALAGVAARVVNAGVTFITNVLFARLLGVEAFGHYSAANTWLLLVAGVSTLGLTMMPQRFWPELERAGDKARLRGLVRFAVAGPLAAGLGMALIAVLVLMALGPSVGRPLLVALMVAIAAVPAMALLAVMEGVALARGWRDFAYGITFVLRPMLVPVFFAVAIVLGGKLDAPHALAAFVAASWVTALLLLAGILWRVRRELGRGPVIEERPVWLRAALPVLAVDAVFLLMTSIDMIALSFLAPAEQVGVYGAAARLVALVAFVHYGMTWATGHHFSALNEAGDAAVMAGYARRMALWTFLPSLAAALLVLLLTPFLLSLFGRGFAAGVPVTAILLVGLLARAAMGPAEQLLIMTDNQLECAFAYGWGLVVNTAVSFWLVPSMGAIGAAVGAAAGYLAASVLIVVAVRRCLGFLILPLPDRLGLRERLHA
jgi:O-antigen/teichoic acid export membrane protein